MSFSATWIPDSLLTARSGMTGIRKKVLLEKFLISILGYQDGVFEAVAESVGEVDTGFYGDDHVGHDGCDVALTQGWLFVDVEPDAVACGVDKLRAVAAPGNEVAGSFIEMGGS